MLFACHIFELRPAIVKRDSMCVMSDHVGRRVCDESVHVKFEIAFAAVYDRESIPGPFFLFALPYINF